MAAYERLPAGPAYEATRAHGPDLSPPVGGRETTPAERAAASAAAVNECERLVAQLEGAEPARDPRHHRIAWFEQRSSALAALSRARRSTASEPRLAELERRISVAPPPLGYRPIAGEAAIVERLAAPIEGGTHAGIPSRVQELQALFDLLAAADRRELSARLANPAQHDPLYAPARGRMGRRVPQLIAYLRDGDRRDALRREAAKRLPDPIRGDLEAATGRALGHVRVHAGDDGARIASAHSARAVAIGADIYMGEGQLDLDSAGGRELLAHEVAHVVQTETVAAPTTACDPVAAAEHEADAFAAAFRARGAAVSFVPTAGIRPGAAMLKANSAPTHEAFEATLDYDLDQARKTGALITAPQYMHLHMKELRASIGRFLLGRGLTTGNAQVSFGADGLIGFLAELAKPLDTDDDADNVARLRKWMAPTDVYALVDRSRAIYDKGDADATADYARGPKGPTTWFEPVAVALGSELEAELRVSLARMSARLVATTAAKRVTLHRPTAAVRDAAELVPSTPLDWEVAYGMMGRRGAAPTVVVEAGKLSVDPDARVSYEAIHRVDWQGPRGGPRNALRVLEPADASAESVAAWAMGSPTEAYRLQRVGVYWLVPDEVAAKFPAAGQAGRGGDATSLAFDTHAADSIAAEMAHTHVGAKAVATPTWQVLTARWDEIDNLLHGIAFAVVPFGLDKMLAEALRFHAQRRHELLGIDAHAADARGRELTSQHGLLVQIAAELATVLESAEKAKRGGAVRDALAALVDAASVAHLPLTCRARLDAAGAHGLAAVGTPLEGMLGQAITLVEVANGLEDSSATRRNGGFTQRAEALRTRIADARTHGGEAAAILRIEDDIVALERDARLVAQIASLRKLVSTLDAAEDSNWTLFSESALFEALSGPLATAEIERLWGKNERSDDNHIGRLERLKRGGFALGESLKRVWRRWTAVRKQAEVIETSLAGANVADAHQIARDSVATELAEIDAELAKIKSDTNIEAFITIAAQTMKNASHRAILGEVFAMLAIGLASGGVGSVAAGLAAEGSATATLLSFVAESYTFARLTSAIEGTSFWDEIVPTLAGNALAFGGSAYVTEVLRATKAGLTLAEAAKGLEVAKGALRTAKLAHLVPSTLIGLGAQLGMAEAQVMIARGETLDEEAIVQSSIQGIALVLGSAVVDHLATHPEAKLGGRRDELLKRARDVAASGDPVRALQLVREVRALLGSGGAGDAAAAKSLEALDGGVLVAHLQLASVVPGRVYAGDAAALDRVAGDYHARGYTVDKIQGGYEVHGAGGANGLRLMESETAHAPRSAEPDRGGSAELEQARARLTTKTTKVDDAKIDAQMRGPGHAGVELHSHMMGNVDPVRFRDELFASGRDPMRTPDAHGVTPDAVIGDVSTWEPMLRQVVAMPTPLGHEMDAKETVTRRGVSGDAIEQAKKAQQRITQFKKVLQDPNVEPPGRQRLIDVIDSIAKSAVQKSFQTSDETDFNSSYEIRDEAVKSFYGTMDRLAVLADKEPFASAAPRLLHHFAGRATMEERIRRAASLEAVKHPSAKQTAELASLDTSIRQQFAYDAYVRDTLIQLASDGVEYTEQSNSLNKLMKRFDDGQIDAMKQQAKKLRPDLAAKLDALIVKHLVMINTRDFGERSAASETPSPKRMNDAQFHAQVGDAIAMMQRSDVAGMDIAGPEAYELDAAGMVRLTYVYDELAKVALARGKSIVFRPHVGEGANDVQPGALYGRDHSRQTTEDGQLTHYARASKNIDTMLGVLEAIAARPENAKYGGRLPPEVEIRLGHVTHATAADAGRMRVLGVVAEVNLTSNHQTGSVARDKPAPGQPDRTHPGGTPRTYDQDQTAEPDFTDHGVLSMVFNDVDIALSTDGSSVMNTTLSREYVAAAELLKSMLDGRTRVRVTVEQARAMNADGGNTQLGGAQGDTVEVSYNEMSSAKKHLFDRALRKMFEVADRYHPGSGASGHAL